MAKKSEGTIQVGTFEADFTNSGTVLEHSLREGNQMEHLSITPDEFVDLYNVVLALAQVHPEWLQ